MGANTRWCACLPSNQLFRNGNFFPATKGKLKVLAASFWKRIWIITKLAVVHVMISRNLTSSRPSAASAICPYGTTKFLCESGERKPRYSHGNPTCYSTSNRCQVSEELCINEKNNSFLCRNCVLLQESKGLDRVVFSRKKMVRFCFLVDVDFSANLGKKSSEILPNFRDVLH